MSAGRKPRQELRGATARKDVAALTALLGDGVRHDQLQLAGEGVLLLLSSEVVTGDLGPSLCSALRERGWDGDEELADEVEARLTGRTTTLRPVPVDLAAVVDLMEDGVGSGDGLLDLQTGETWPAMILEDDTGLDVRDVDDDPDRWLGVPTSSSRERRRDMRDFAELQSGLLQARLLDAIEGRGAFSRFRRVLDHADQSVATEWTAFSEERSLGRARAWLATEGYVPRVG